MKSELVILAAASAIALAGCDTTRHRYPPGIRVTKARIIEETPEEPASDALVKRIKEQQQALENEQPIVEPVAAPVAEAATESESPVTEKPLSEQSGEKELTVENLIAELEARSKRTPAEQEAYRMLLGMAAENKPAGEGRVWSLLSEACDALAKDDLETAQAKTNEALALLRSRTDPQIDRVFFAREVRNYGNADVIEDPSLRAGQLVLVVTDISNFACLPVGSEDPPELYQARMTQRLAVYDSGGALYWQESYGPFEYQAAGSISTMFLPRKFRLPAGLKPGKYTVKSEIIDHLAGRQTQKSVEFTVP